MIMILITFEMRNELSWNELEWINNRIVAFQLTFNIKLTSNVDNKFNIILYINNWLLSLTDLTMLSKMEGSKSMRMSLATFN